MKGSVIHLYLYGMIRRKCKNNRVIHISKIRPIVKWTTRLPEKYRMQIVQELVECGFLRKLTRDDYEIVHHNITPLSDSIGRPLW